MTCVKLYLLQSLSKMSFCRTSQAELPSVMDVNRLVAISLLIVLHSISAKRMFRQELAGSASMTWELVMMIFKGCSAEPSELN